MLIVFPLHILIKMPKNNNRKRAIEDLQQQVNHCQKMAIHRELLSDEDSIEDERDQYHYSLLKKMKESRYLFRSSTYRKKRKKFDLRDCLSDDSVEYNTEEFCYCFHMSRESFRLLLNELQDKKAFSDCKKRKQRPIAYQLLVFLFRVGKQGTCGSSIAVGNYFGIGKGSVNNYIRRCVEALHEIHDDVVYWPNKTERDEMKARVASTGFRHCVGIVDGTLVVLEFKPEKYHKCYYSHKSVYGLNVMIVCDDQKRVTYYVAGWPGSTHDNRVFRTSSLFLNREEFFSFREYLLGDSAYSTSSVMVQSFKRHAAWAVLPADKELFNTYLAKLRIRSEHCIGILKGRFGCLKHNNIQLKDGKKEVKELVELIGSCIVMHNLLINCEDEIPAEWYDELRRSIDWSLYDEDQQPQPNVGDKDGNRREQVFQSIINNYI
jgi:hypothetical protein